MELLELAGYIAALLVGLSMGLIGGGGSILTVPILVYLFHISPTLAISYSLFIVGFTSLIGAVRNYKRKLVNIKTVGLFGLSSITTVFISRKFIIPYLPEVFFNIGDFEVTHSFFVMVVFALLMLFASYSMITSKAGSTNKPHFQRPAIILLFGLFIGLVTGFLGAGGGFLLVPALIIFMNLPVKEAIGTSLMIIALNSLIGFLGDLGLHPVHWEVLLSFTAVAIGGMYIGLHYNKKIDSLKLKRGFGWFLVGMALFIIAKEFLKY